jgi:hypothetical protein
MSRETNVHPSILDYASSIPTKNNASNFTTSNSQEPSATLEPLELSHNIPLPSSLNLPDLSFTPLTEVSPVDNSSDKPKENGMGNAQSNLKSQDLANASEGLLREIYRILRDPSSAESNSPEGSRSSISSSPISQISPLFSSRSPNWKRHYQEDLRTASLNIRPKTQTCEICGEAKDVAVFPTRPTAQCQHNSSTCSQCLRLWIESQIDAGNLMHIKCPGKDCDKEMAHSDVQHLASVELFKK